MTTIRQQLTTAIHDRFDADLATEILEDKTFENLVTEVRLYCVIHKVDPATTLDTLDLVSVVYVSEGDVNPAEFLTSQVTNLHRHQGK